MNLKVAHLVSVQFGIFIGIVCCLVFFRFEYARPRTAAEMRKPATKQAAAVDPLSQSEDQTADGMDNDPDAELADLVTEQPASLPNEYSPEAVERYRAEATRLYYEQIAPRRNPSAGAANSSIAYTEVAQEPEVVQTNDSAPQPVAYVQPTEVVVYQPVQVVAFSRPRRFANRCRPALPPGALGSNPHQRPDRGGITHLNAPPAFGSPASPAPLGHPPGAPGIAHRRNAAVPSCPSPQGIKPPGKP